jgi:SAM-dependent methyltransferase
MGPEGLMGSAVRLGAAVDALAALAAYVRVETEDLPADPQVRELLAAVASEVLGETVGPGDVGGAGEGGGAGGTGDLDLRTAGAAVGLARAFLRQGAELIDNPGRSGGWDQVDVPLLQSIGRMSMAISDVIRAAEGRLEGLGELLTAPGARFLDIGTGTAWLAIAMARSHPGLQVVGIDIFAPALDLARTNVDAEGLAGAVELRLQDAVTLDEPDGYDAIWVPMPFLPKAIVPDVIAAAARSLRPGGWVLPGTFGGPDDRLSQLLTELRIVRAGGHPWRPEEFIGVLEGAGMVDAGEVPRTWAATLRLYAGRRGSPG